MTSSRGLSSARVTKPLCVATSTNGSRVPAFRMFGGEGNFKQAFSVVLYGWFPQLIKGILMAIVAIVARARLDFGRSLSFAPPP